MCFRRWLPKSSVSAASLLIHAGPVGTVREEHGNGVDHRVRLNHFEMGRVGKSSFIVNVKRVK